MQRLRREEGRRHEGKSGILRAAHLDFASESLSTPDHELIHNALRAMRSGKPTTDDRPLPSPGLLSSVARLTWRVVAPRRPGGVPPGRARAVAAATGPRLR